MQGLQTSSSKITPHDLKIFDSIDVQFDGLDPFMDLGTCGLRTKYGQRKN